MARFRIYSVSEPGRVQRTAVVRRQRLLLWTAASLFLIAGATVLGLGGCTGEEEPPATPVAATDIGEPGGGQTDAEPAEAPEALTTEYCPGTPHFTGTSVCFVLYQAPDRVLVQHGDPALGIYYLEDRMGDLSEYFEIPLEIKELRPGGYTVTAIPGEFSTYVFNGEPMLCATYEGALTMEGAETHRN